MNLLLLSSKFTIEVYRSVFNLNKFGLSFTFDKPITIFFYINIVPKIFFFSCTCFPTDVCDLDDWIKCAFSIAYAQHKHLVLFSPSP